MPRVNLVASDQVEILNTHGVADASQVQTILHPEDQSVLDSIASQRAFLVTNDFKVIDIAAHVWPIQLDAATDVRATLKSSVQYGDEMGTVMGHADDSVMIKMASGEVIVSVHDLDPVMAVGTAPAEAKLLTIKPAESKPVEKKATTWIVKKAEGRVSEIYPEHEEVHGTPVQYNPTDPDMVNRAINQGGPTYVQYVLQEDGRVGVVDAKGKVLGSFDALVEAQNWVQKNHAGLLSVGASDLESIIELVAAEETHADLGKVTVTYPNSWIDGKAATLEAVDTTTGRCTVAVDMGEPDGIVHAKMASSHLTASDESAKQALEAIQPPPVEPEEPVPELFPETTEASK